MHGSRQDLTVSMEMGDVVIREVEWGDLNVALESFPPGVDSAPIFKGLPDDRCQCPHWGYVTKGRLRAAGRAGTRTLSPECEHPTKPAIDARRWAVHPALLYGQLHKRYHRRRLVRIKYQMYRGTRGSGLPRMRGHRTERSYS